MRICILILLFTASLAHVASAQHPRMIFLEVGTNASCEPCAKQFPILESFLERDDVARYVVPIVYHAFWPGFDTMNAIAPAMHDERIRGYYNMIGMPTAVVNGQFYRSATAGLGGSSPGDTVGLRRRIDSLRATTSPIQMSITDTIIGRQLVVRTSVLSSDSVAYRLRIAVVERHHFYEWPLAGNNGEEHFHRIVRAMAPNTTGHAANLRTNIRQTFDDTVTIDPRWTSSELYVVAFVQRDDTRDVVQAVSTEQHLSLTPDAPAARVVGNGSDTSTWRTHATPSRDGIYNITVEKELPPGWSASVNVNGYRIAGDTTVVLDSGSVDKPIDVTIVPDVTAPGKGVVRVIVSGDRGAIDTAEYRVYAGDIGIPVLPWHEANRPHIMQQIAIALERTAHRHAIVHRDDDNLFHLPDYAVVVAIVGDDTLSRSQRDRLHSYLNTRGRLLITGSRIAQSLGDPEFDENGIPRDTNFLHNYLHATYVAPGSATLAVNGLRNDPIGNDIGFILDGGRHGVASPERIRPRHNALPVFYYGSSRDSIGGLRFGRPEHRVVYIAYGVENISDTAKRTLVLGRSIDWLLGDEITTGVDDESVADASITIAPNPSRGVIAIETSVREDGRLTVYSALGERVASYPLARGANRIALDLSLAARGVYFVAAQQGTERRVRSIVVE